MWITEFCLRHRTTVFFLIAAILVAGMSAYMTLPRESSPDISIPVIVVYTLYPGASPADIETQVTHHLERELQGLDGLENLTSASQESMSVVTVELVSGTDIDTALQKVRDRVDRAKVDLPDDAEEPVLQEINFSDFPILQVNLSGDVGPVVLKDLAEDLQDAIEVIPGVLRVSLVGGLEREVKVDVDPERLRLYGLALDDVVDAIRDEHVAIPGGDLKLGDLAYAVRVPGEVGNPLEIADFVIKSRNGRPVFIRDVATVTFGFEDRTSYARINGRESVALSVQKRVGTNLIEVADAVKETVERERERWPQGVEATILADQSEEIRMMVKDLENNILSGLVLVILVLMSFLGLRTAFFVGLAIPFSMLLSFVVLQLSGSTLNMVTLFSLVLAVGMLVDNAVVVIENIYRHMQEGRGALVAAREATGEVGGAIAVSTFTTVGAFLPVLFWPGVVGDFMIYLPMTVSIALLASLIVAFTINPVMCASFLKVRPKDLKTTSREASEAGIRGGFLALYRRTLSYSLDHRRLVVAGTVGLFALVLVLFVVFNPGVEFFPDTEPPQVFVDVELPPGTRLEKTDSIIRNFEDRMEGLPDLEVMAAGSGAGSQADFFDSGGADSAKARISLDLIDRKDRQQNSFLTVEAVRGRTAGLPGVTVDVDYMRHGPPVGEPLSIELQGLDFATLGAISARAREALAEIPGLVSLDDDFDLARPEIVIAVDRTQAARLGLTTAKIASTLRTAVTGSEAATFRQGDKESEIRVRLREESRSSLEDLERLTVVNESGEQIPLGAIAELRRSAALTAIRHKDQKRVVTISGKVTSPPLAEPVRQEARRRLDAMEDLLPAGYSLTFAGQSEEEDEAKAFLSKAFVYGVLLVLALIVGKFDSLAIPLIILTSVVMSMIGVLLGLMVMNLPFGIIMTGLGVISLAGIVVNNAIVLLDYGEKLWARGLERREVVISTGMRRVRPVLLTAVTTILGLIPLSSGVEFDFRELAFSTGGESSQWWRSMGVAVIFGLGFATFLTLVLVPVLYDLLLEWRERRGQQRSPAESETQPVAADETDLGEWEKEPEAEVAV